MSKEMNIFDLNVNDFKSSSTESKSELYKPVPEEGSAGVYTALIRFLPNPKNPTKSKITKHSHWLEDRDGNGFYFDCPSTVGKKCIVCNEFFRLKDSDSAIDQEKAPDFRRQTGFFHLVQIIDDKHNPELNGKIMIYKFGWKIHEKYQELLEPDFGDPVIPADLFRGRNFLIKIKKVGGWNNYDSCKFLDKSEPIVIDGERMNPKNKEHLAQIKKYLEDAPDLSKFEYSEWSDEDLKKIRTIIAGGVVKANVDNALTSSTVDDFDVGPSSTEVSETDDGSDDSLDDIDSFANSIDADDTDDDLDAEPEKEEKPKSKPKPKKEKKEEDPLDGDLDDIDDWDLDDI